MHTEEETKTKWCPFARCAMKGDKDGWYVNGINRWPLAADQHQTGPMCIASECMAWRWGPYVDEKGNPAEPGRAYEVGSLEQQGYCGLAGKPDGC